MATYTDNLYITSSRLADGYVEAWLSSETDTTATIYWKIGCRQKSAALYGQEANGYVDGSYVGYCSGYLSSSSSSWKEVCSNSGYVTVNKTSSGRNVPVSISTRVTPINGYGSVTTDWASATCYVPISGITIYSPNAPSALNNVRESDNKNQLYWTAPSTSTTKPVSAILIERSVDGGAWSQIASVSGSATSYNDTSTTADHSYKYRIRSQNSAGYSSYVESQTSYNTPSAPTKVTVSRLAETTVKLEIENPAKTAQGVEIHRSEDGDTWEFVANVQGAPVTETTDEPGGGTFYYRVRNTRDGQDGGILVSAWSPTSNAVVTICAPSAPTLLTPASGRVVSKAEGSVVFAWAHNPIDGSAQTAAKLRYSLDKGVTWTEVEIEGSAASYEIENAFAVNSEVTWGVCTKGTHEDYGPWSDNRVFYVYQMPSVAFAQPADGFTVENMPIVVELQYDDASGTLANATFTVSDGYRAVYTRNMGTETTCEIQATEWLPEDGKTYTLTVAVRSSSTLTASTIREIAVSFVPPKPALLHIENDGETGYASLVVSVGNDEELEAPTSISVYRAHDGERVLLGEGLQAGAGLVDKYAPLNTDYQYIAVTHAESGAINSQVYPNEVRSIKWFLYHDEGLASAIYNPESDIKLSRPSKKQVHYAGRRWPVSFDGYNVSDERSLSAALFTYDDMEAFRALMYSGGRCVFKSYDGDVFHADVDVSLKPDFTTPNLYGTVTLNIVRIDGGDL